MIKVTHLGEDYSTIEIEGEEYEESLGFGEALIKEFGGNSNEKGIIDEVPSGITSINLEALLMPNGEIICLGKTLGWFKDLGKFITKK